MAERPNNPERLLALYYVRIFTEVELDSALLEAIRDAILEDAQMFCWWVVSFESRKDAFIIMLATPPLTCFDDIMDTITEDVEESLKKKFPNLKQVLMPG
ncbi:hypothetical protein B9Q02_10680, partial [Candidatus Marsarchaeota G1 archaeon BE_D]